MYLYWYLPQGVTNPVLGLSTNFTGTWWKPFTKSSLDEFPRHNNNVNPRHQVEFRDIRLSNLLKCMKTLMVLSFFLTGNIGIDQGARARLYDTYGDRLEQI